MLTSWVTVQGNGVCMEYTLCPACNRLIYMVRGENQVIIEEVSALQNHPNTIRRK